MMNFDVFISHSSKDKPMADAACATLEKSGIRCWIAPRDIRPGQDWDELIVRAIDQCRAMVLIFTQHTNELKQVGREVKRAFNKEKPVIPLRVEDALPGQTLGFYLDTVHWLDAFTPPLEAHLRQLTDVVKAILGVEGESAASDVVPPPAIDPHDQPEPPPPPVFTPILEAVEPTPDVAETKSPASDAGAQGKKCDENSVQHSALQQYVMISLISIGAIDFILSLLTSLRTSSSETEIIITSGVSLALAVATIGAGLAVCLHWQSRTVVGLIVCGVGTFIDIAAMVLLSVVIAKNGDRLLAGLTFHKMADTAITYFFVAQPLSIVTHLPGLIYFRRLRTATGGDPTSTFTSPFPPSPQSE